MTAEQSSASRRSSASSAHGRNETSTSTSRKIGPALIVERLRARFGIRNICIVADRGMISENTMEQIEVLNWMVESIFRSMKSLLRTRPMCDKCDDPIRGHVWCLFLALIVRKELQDRLEQKRTDVDEPPLEWADVVRDLDNLAETEMVVSGKRYLVRTETKPAAAKVFKACGVALPPVLRQC